MFFCPKQTSEEECLGPQKFHKFQTLQCAKEATPIVQQLNDKNTRCGPSGIGTAYEVIYKVSFDIFKAQLHTHDWAIFQFE